MARSFSSVKLTSGFVARARREAELLHRSLSGQIEHWARLGEALESAPDVFLEHIREALAGRLRLEALSSAEQDGVFDQLSAHFQLSPDAVRARYAAL